MASTTPPPSAPPTSASASSPAPTWPSTPPTSSSSTAYDSIVDAICLGRLVFQNLQKVIAYLLLAGSWSDI